ncbi:hypothetical protein Tco_0548319 [Tanacetum coccineum]
MLKPRFASQVDLNNNLSRPVTQRYLPKRRESVFAKPDHKIASSESRNSFKNMPRFSSNDMAHNHYLDRHKKEIGTQKLVCCLLLDFKALLMVANQNLRHRFSPNKTSVVYEKTSPRSDLRWKPTGRIFKSVGLRWIPTGKLFDSYTSKVDSKPPHGSNVDIPNIHECKQTLDVSAGTSINVQKEQSLDLSAASYHNINKSSFSKYDSHDVNDRIGKSIRSFVEYFNGVNQVVTKSSVVTAADASVKRQQQPYSTSSTSTLATTVTADGNFDL